MSKIASYVRHVWIGVRRLVEQFVQSFDRTVVSSFEELLKYLALRRVDVRLSSNRDLLFREQIFFGFDHRRRGHFRLLKPTYWHETIARRPPTRSFAPCSSAITVTFRFFSSTAEAIGN